MSRSLDYRTGYDAGWRDGYAAAQTDFPPNMVVVPTGRDITPWLDADYDDDDEDLPPAFI